MYGLKQAALLAYNNLKESLQPHGYTPIIGTVGMWEHKTRKTKFCLCVDDFGIKYFNKDDADHLVQSIKKTYECTIDWNGNNYCGLTIDWHYADAYIDISIPKFVQKALPAYSISRTSTHNSHPTNMYQFNME